MVYSARILRLSNTLTLERVKKLAFCKQPRLGPLLLELFCCDLSLLVIHKPVSAVISLSHRRSPHSCRPHT